MSLKPTYLIEVDPLIDYMRLTFSGMMDHPTMDRFEQDLAAAFACRPSTEGSPGHWLFLADLRSSGVQSRDISARQQTIMAGYGPLTRRTAMILSGSSLEMLQARRVAAPDSTNFFTKEDDAVAWLLEDSTEVAAAA